MTEPIPVWPFPTGKKPVPPEPKAKSEIFVMLFAVACALTMVL